ncbi:hypothetical protein LINPERPRIM_LOCUS20140 [Linum perenne]
MKDWRRSSSGVGWRRSAADDGPFGSTDSATALDRRSDGDSAAAVCCISGVKASCGDPAAGRATAEGAVARDGPSMAAELKGAWRGEGKERRRPCD